MWIGNGRAGRIGLSSIDGVSRYVLMLWAVFVYVWWYVPVCVEIFKWVRLVVGFDASLCACGFVCVCLSVYVCMSM